MTKESIIQKTVKVLNKLPVEKVTEVADFTDFVLKKYLGHKIQNGNEKILEGSNAFQFLNDEEDIYTIDDIKEKY